MNRIDAFAIFAKVGELESISGAARALGLPKANVSRAVSGLEADFGVSLVERTTRNVVLTEIGRRLHERCDRVLQEIRAVDAEIAAYREAPQGTLLVGCPSYVSSRIAPHLPRFLDQHPEVELRLKVADRVLPDPYGFDLVLHVGWLADSSLIARKIHDVPMILIASRDYLSRHDPIRTPADLLRHPVIGLYYTDSRAGDQSELPAVVPRLELHQADRCYPLPQWNRFSTNDQSAIIEVVRQGRAIAPTAGLLARDQLLSGEFVHVLPEFAVGPAPALYAVYASRASPPPKVRAFVDFIAAAVPSILG